ncbi:phosphonatase-like hydrolase [Sphingobacterium olei]|nr:phosphonatase-like hydrolase [Sphingobacterium olei]
MIAVEKNDKIKMVVCDMAGTTVDEDNLVYKTLHRAINRHGYAVSLEDVLAHGAGKEKKQAIESILTSTAEKVDPSVIELMFRDFLQLLDQAYQTAAISAQDNALDFFQALQKKNIRIVLNTGYNKHTAETLLQQLDWKVGRDIDALITADDVARNRPHPDMILFAMDQFGIESGQAVAKIGDSAVDIAEGQNAGCRFSIGITTGAHTVAQLSRANPSHIVDNLLEVLPLLEQ